MSIDLKSHPIFIGTAGWSVPAVHRSLFSKHGTHLERYALRFNAVEINTSFYRPHRRLTYERWAAQVPSDFTFAVKLPKAITHEKRLLNCQDLVTRFAEEVGGLGNKLGAVLVQFPPTLSFKIEEAEEFFANLNAAIKSAIVCEPRHSSWFAAAAEDILVRYRISRVGADPAPVPGADQPTNWGDVIYFRLHGSPRIYYSNYDTFTLQRLSDQVRHNAQRSTSTWCIFDNTASHAAIENAISMIALQRHAI